MQDKLDNLTNGYPPVCKTCFAPKSFSARAEYKKLISKIEKCNKTLTKLSINHSFLLIIRS